MSLTPESVQQLLNSENFGDRIQGINQLRQLDSALAFKMIQPLITDENARIRYAAVSQLDTLGKNDLDTSWQLLSDRLFDDPEVDVQAAAADAIAALKIKDAFPQLEQVYRQSSEWLLQFSIIAALGELGDLRAFPLLQEALSADNSLIQTAAISALGELGNPDAVDLLIPLANHQDWQIRHRVAQALGNLKGESAYNTLKQLAEDSVEQVAQEAKYYLP